MRTLSSVSHEVQHSFSMFGVARNDVFFEKIFKTVLKKFTEYDVNNLGTRVLSTCYSNFWWIPS